MEKLGRAVIRETLWRIRIKKNGYYGVLMTEKKKENFPHKADSASLSGGGTGVSENLKMKEGKTAWHGKVI